MGIYNSEIFVEVIIKDYSGARLETFKWSTRDKQLENTFFYRLKGKYGIFQFDRDLKWAKNNE